MSRAKNYLFVLKCHLPRTQVRVGDQYPFAVVPILSLDLLLIDPESSPFGLEVLPVPLVPDETLVPSLQFVLQGGHNYLPPVALKIDARRIEKHHREVSEEIPPPLKDLLLDHVFNAPWRKGGCAPCSPSGSSSPSHPIARYR